MHCLCKQRNMGKLVHAEFRELSISQGWTSICRQQIPMSKCLGYRRLNEMSGSTVLKKGGEIIRVVELQICVTGTAWGIIIEVSSFNLWKYL